MMNECEMCQGDIGFHRTTRISVGREEVTEGPGASQESYQDLHKLH